MVMTAIMTIIMRWSRGTRTKFGQAVKSLRLNISTIVVRFSKLILFLFFFHSAGYLHKLGNMTLCIIKHQCTTIILHTQPLPMEIHWED